MRSLRLMIVPAMALALAACSNGQAGDKQTLGTLIGGAAGGLAGAQIGDGKGQLAATAAGALLGAFFGNQIGESLDRADRLYAEQASQDALENNASGEQNVWNNPDSGKSGTVTPTRTYQTNDGRYCREFQQTVTVGGREESAYGRACRQPDGSWEIQS